MLIEDATLCVSVTTGHECNTFSVIFKLHIRIFTFIVQVHKGNVVTACSKCIYLSLQIATLRVLHATSFMLSTPSAVLSLWTTLATIVVTYESREAMILILVEKQVTLQKNTKSLCLSRSVSSRPPNPRYLKWVMTQAFANKVTMYPCQYYHHLIRRRSNT